MTAAATAPAAPPPVLARAPAESDDALRAQALAIHRRTCIADIHTHGLLGIGYLGLDLGRGGPGLSRRNPLRNILDLVDLPRAREGGVKALVFVSYVLPSPLKRYDEKTKRMVAAFRRFLARHEGRIEQAFAADDVARINAGGKIAAILAVEGGHALGGRLAMLEWLREAGAVYLTLTHFVNNDLSASATHPGRDYGLTPRGREALREMERLGILADLSHSSRRAKRDAFRLARAPLICSHTGLRRFWGAARATGDDEVRAVAATGGLVGLLLSPVFLAGRTRAGVEAIVANVDHICSLVGADHVCIGSDFDSGLPPPDGMRDLRDYPEITVALVRRGYDEETIAKIWSGNFFRVLRAVGR